MAITRLKPYSPFIKTHYSRQKRRDQYVQLPRALIVFSIVGYRHIKPATAHRRSQKQFNDAPAQNHWIVSGSIASKTNLETYIGSPVLTVQGKSLLLNVVAVTPQYQVRSHRRKLTRSKSRYQMRKSSLLRYPLHRSSERYIHKLPFV